MLNDVLMSEAGAARDGLHVAIIATGFNKITVESGSINLLISLLNSHDGERVGGKCFQDGQTL